VVGPRFAKTENQLVGEFVSLDLELVIIKYDCLYSVALHKFGLCTLIFFFLDDFVH